MCLNVHPNTKPKVLEEDLEVYKVVNKRHQVWYKGLNLESYIALYGDVPYVYLSPYRVFQYELGKRYSSVLDEHVPIHPEHGNGTIERGLHSFASLDDAREFTDSLIGSVILRGVIPAGSTMYEGEWEFCKLDPTDTDDVLRTYVKSYASDTLRVEEEIEESK